MNEGEQTPRQPSRLELAAFAVMGIVVGLGFWFVMSYFAAKILANGSSTNNSPHMFALAIYYLVMTALVGGVGIWAQFSRLSRRIRIFLSFCAFSALGMFCLCDVFFVGALSDRNN